MSSTRNLKYLRTDAAPIEMWLDRKSAFQLVQEFHDKFGLAAQRPEYPQLIQDPELEQFRQKFMQEELDEYKEAVAAGDLPKAFDALIDLVYVALGTADFMGCPFDWGFLEVHLANMEKVRAERKDQSKRGTSFDVVKPEGWTPPDIEEIVMRHTPSMSCED